jgi:hypothetical protein
VCDVRPKHKSKAKGKASKGRGKSTVQPPKTPHHHHHHYHADKGEASSSGTVGYQCSTELCRCEHAHAKSGKMPVSAGIQVSSIVAVEAANVAAANATAAQVVCFAHIFACMSRVWLSDVCEGNII